MIRLFLKKGYWKIFVSIILLVIVFFQNDLGKALSNLDLKHIHYLYLFIALAVFLIGHVFGHMSWLFVIRSKKKQIMMAPIASSYWQGLFFNNILPTNIGGDVVKGLNIIKKNGSPYFFIGTIFVDRIINFSVMFFIGILSAVYYWGTLVYSMTTALLFILIFSIFSIFIDRILYSLGLRGEKIWKNRHKKIIQAIFFLRSLLKNKENMRKVIFYAFGSQACKFFVLHLIAFALHVEINPFLLIVITVVQALFALLPVTIGGLGAREHALSLFRYIPELDLPGLTIVTILSHFLLLLSTLPGILFFYFDKIPKK